MTKNKDDGAEPSCSDPLETEGGGEMSSLAFPVVGIGASAGGLQALTLLFRALPADTGMAFVVVQHLARTQESVLPEILARETRMPVAQVTDSTPVEPNHVYVIPPGATMAIEGGALKLLPQGEGRAVNRSVDQFLRSLAEDQGYKSIGIVLSGSATDGTLGLEEIKAAGGITFAQDDSAQHESMPRSAEATGCVDFVLDPQSIAAELTRIARHPYVAEDQQRSIGKSREADVTPVLEIVRKTTGVDFSDYKRNTLYRRITRRALLHKLDGLKEYENVLQEDPQEVQALYQDILISVTSFFRNPEAYEVIASKVFPRIVAGRSRAEPVRLWVQGCSSGEEAYSLAIAFTEFAAANKCDLSLQVFATDLNGAAIERARAAHYGPRITADVSPERLRRFFVEVDGGYRIGKDIRDKCIFAQHNVLTAPPFSTIDLVSCRNLLIYLERELQQKLLPILHYSLKPRGFLWLGSSETIGNYRDLFEIEDPKNKIYSKKVGVTRLVPHIPLGRAVLEPGRPMKLAPLRESTYSLLEAQKEADRVLLQRFAPPGVLVNTELEILQFRGDTGAYLKPAAGKASFNLLRMLREGLMVGVRTAIESVRKDGRPTRMEGLRVKTNGGWSPVDVEVVPLPNESGSNSFLVLFEDADPARRSTAKTLAEGVVGEGRVALDHVEAEHEIDRLLQELDATRDYLRSVIEQQEGANAELQSANEEVQSSNEELQSINEELETSKEEIQSSNEELATVNDELQKRNHDLGISHNDLLNLLASAQVALVMLGPDLRIRRFTPMAEKLFNLIPADIGRPIGDIKLNLTVSDLEPMLFDVMHSVRMRELEVQDRRGRYYLLRLRPYKTTENKVEGAVVVVVDVDSLKQSLATQRRQAELLERTHEPILMWDLGTGIITYWNQGAEKIYGHPRHEALGKVVHELLASRPDPEAFEAVLRRQGEWIGEVVHTTRDGLRIELESRRVLVTEDDQVVVIETNRPITEYKRLEQALRKQAADLLEIDRNRNEFLAILAHELRNPLAPLLHGTYLLKSGTAEAEAIDQTKVMLERQVCKMARMVNDLLDVARIVQGRIHIEKEVVELGPILQHVVENARARIEGREQTMTLVLPDRPVYLFADAIRLEQVLDNLVDNASKFTQVGGHVWISAAISPAPAENRPTTAKLDETEAAPPQEGEIVLRVRDNGIGIEEDVLPRLFRMFIQGNSSLDRAYGGLGIGLTLARRIVELHGGSIGAVSAGKGSGSEFTVRLPTVAPPAQKRASAAQRKTSVPTVPRRVLVVDDNADSGESLGRLLELASHEVRVVRDTEAALREAEEFEPEVAILSVGLPSGDGIELASKLRRRPELEGLLLIALTGFGREEDRRRAWDAGFDYHFTKPGDPEELARLIAQHPLRSQ